MRRPHPRIRKATKWSSTAFSLILLAAWGVSEFRTFGFDMHLWGVRLRLGFLLVAYDEFGGGSHGLIPVWAWNDDRVYADRC